jgi:tRNA-Thr(GGU) m(6)t(6)A37 methyltransferase TsaA
MSTEAPSIRPGEIAATLPEAFDAGVYFIGRIRTPWKKRSDCPRNARGSDAVCTIELDPRYAAALDGVETCTHLVVLYFMHQARRDLVVQVSRHSGRRGTFALRSPVRPNPIAMSVVQLVRVVAGTTLSVVGLDCLDGTPLIDIKPYFPSVDAVPEAVVAWSKTGGE